MNEISIFNFNQNQVRTANIDNQPYFNLNDCCNALGIARGYKSAVRIMSKGVRKTSVGVKTGIKADGTAAIQQVEATFINEPNLYRLIFRSNKPQAQAFADWVYSEVLPSIRKTGGYGVAVSKKEIPALPTPDADLKDWCAQAMALMIENRVRIAIEAERERLKKLIEKAI